MLTLTSTLWCWSQNPDLGFPALDQLAVRGAQPAPSADGRGSPKAMVSGLNFKVDETVDMLRESVMSFASREIAPRAAEIDRTNLT